LNKDAHFEGKILYNGLLRKLNKAEIKVNTTSKPVSSVVSQITLIAFG